MYCTSKSGPLALFPFRCHLEERNRSHPSAWCMGTIRLVHTIRGKAAPGIIHSTRHIVRVGGLVGGCTDKGMACSQRKKKIRWINIFNVSRMRLMLCFCHKLCAGA